MSDAATSLVGSGGTDANIPVPRAKFKLKNFELITQLKTCGFAIAFIAAIGGLAVVGAGLAGYYHVGTMSHIGQIEAIVMMSVGGFVSIVGILGMIKNRKAICPQSYDDSNSQIVSQKSDAISPVMTLDRLIYGPDVWPEVGKIWGCILILDEDIPEPPKEEVAKGRVRIYIPQKIKVNGQEKNFTLNTLIDDISIKWEGSKWLDRSLLDCNDAIKKQFGDDTASGWIEIDGAVIPESEEKECRRPHILEAIAVNLLVFAFTDQRLYNGTFTRCVEEVNIQIPISYKGASFGFKTKKESVIVGFSENGMLHIKPLDENQYQGHHTHGDCGIAGVVNL